MPIVPPNSKILVTGASGFIAIHCITVLLDEGFQVVGTVRSADKGEYLTKLFTGKSFTYTIVKDLLDPQAFVGTLDDVAGVIHTASPLFMATSDIGPEALHGPAVQGTLGILRAAKSSTTVQRVVITSSAGAVVSPRSDLPYTFTEDDWNLHSVKEIEEKGKDASATDKYRASKVLAEKAAWAFMEENKPSWDLTAMLPPVVLGPLLQDIQSVDQLNTSSTMIWPVIAGTLKAESLPGPQTWWVDVRDVAKAHVKALTAPEAGGLRIVVSAGSYCHQLATEGLARLYPSRTDIPQGVPGAAEHLLDPENAPLLSSERARAIFDIDYRTLETCMKDLYESGKAKGWIKE